MPIRQQYELGQALNEVGLDFVAKNNLGQPVVRDRTSGEEFVYDLDADLRQLGASRQDTQVIFNSIDKPLAISPLNAGERAKLAVGNERGGIKFLRNKFDAVVPSEDNGLIVLDDGVWKQVDPSGLGGGDAWEMARELGRDVADLTDIGINVAATSAALAAVGGTGGLALPAAVATVGAGGATSGLIRTSLGRYFGTYDAEPLEELADIGLESIFTMGGQAIGAGARPAINAMVKAGSKMGRSGIANGAAAVYGRITGVGPGAMQALFSRGPRIGTAMKSALKSAGPGASTDTAINIAKQRAIDSGETFLKETAEALPKKYGQLLDDVVTKAEQSKLTANMDSILDDSFLSMKESGLGVVETKGNQRIFRAFNEAEKEIRIKNNLDVFDLDDVAEKQIASLVRTLQRFSVGKVLRGGVAANRLVAMNKSLNQLVSKQFAGQIASQEYKAAVSRATKGFRESVGKQFKQAGLGEEYAKLSSLYGEFANSVAVARKLKASPQGIEGFVNRLSTDAGQNMAAKGVANKLVELGGKRGQQLFEDIVIDDSASKFLRWAPKMGLVQTGLIGGGAGAAFTGGLALGPGTIAGVSQFSPRIVAGQFRAMEFAAQHLKFLKSLGPEQMKLFLDSPAAFDATVRAVTQAIGREQTDIDALLQQSGAVPGGQ